MDKDADIPDSERDEVNHPYVKAYVTGLGWCWMSDGEVIELISDIEGH